MPERYLDRAMSAAARRRSTMTGPTDKLKPADKVKVGASVTVAGQRFEVEARIDRSKIKTK